MDTPPAAVDREDAIKEGIELFNQERFWESHEALEQIWRVSEGPEREVLQSLILMAAAFVHCQKGEIEVSRSILRRAKAKMDSSAHLAHVDLEAVRRNVDEILASGRIQPFTIRMNRV